MQVKVVKVKKSDKGDFYKRQMAWELRDLSEVDAKDATKVRFRWQEVREETLHTPSYINLSLYVMYAYLLHVLGIADYFIRIVHLQHKFGVG